MALFSLIKPFGGGNSFKGSVLGKDGDPIRSELYSVERLEEFAREIARDQRNVANPRRFPKLLPRLEENASILIGTYRLLTDAIRNGRGISPAAEWLVDNFHIIEEQLREIRKDLPTSYYRELPKLSTGDDKGFPRIFAIAMVIIAHTDSRLDRDTLLRFLKAYQVVTPLRIGEIWALAITLRLGLVENLRRLAVLIATSVNERDEADDIAAELLNVAARQPHAVNEFLAGHLDRRKTLGRSFVMQLVRQLRDQDASVLPALELLEERLSKEGGSTGQAVQTELQSQAAAQVSVGNVIKSMRLLSTLDWRDFFERVSLVDEVLRSDPSRVYSDMTFETRDRYREVIELVSKRTGTDELAISRHAVEMAAKAYGDDPSDSRRSHVGYYFLGEGAKKFERLSSYRPGLAERGRRLLLDHPASAYFGSLAILTAVIVAAPLIVAYRYGAALPIVVIFGLLSLVPASDLAISMVNWLVTQIIPPRLLPQMETASGIKEKSRTMVARPAIISTEAEVEELIEKLEVDHLANKDPNIYFALLSDPADSTVEESAHDAAILDAAIRGIDELNQKHATGGRSRFFLFHRRRLWNERDSIWMGWERKCGKLFEFNRLLRGAEDTSFVTNPVHKDFLAGIRYVITLDADTQLPRDAGLKLIGAAEHPLNRPQLDDAQQRVVKGYGVLQPRVSISLPSASRSYFSRILAGDTGFDPYTTAASDVYQDLFGEGSFTGKGLYDVDMFRAALKNRIPDNTVLSHDLLEGLFARCGLVTDIELVDDLPTRYDTFSYRAHRWVRGDWQIIRWLWPSVSGEHGFPIRSYLPLVSRWKIVDNLRRSLVAFTTALWLAFAWLLVPGPPLGWTALMLVGIAFPVYADAAKTMMNRQLETPWRSHFRSVSSVVNIHFVRVVLLVITFPHRAYLDVDAIIRTLYRQFISHKKLLEWKTAAMVEKEQTDGPGVFIRLMWIAPVWSIVLLVMIGIFRTQALAAALPFLITWFLSPLIAYLLSQRVDRGQRELSAGEIGQVRLITRKTWRFFETFVGDEDNWLPPDNYQEDPEPKIEHRTSPTNIGMFLMSTVAANDLGYLGIQEFAERLGFTLATLAKLDKLRGHFLNWYDTRTLKPLNPRYVSTVDSGNLAGHLIAIKNAMISAAGQPILDTRAIAGLTDTLEQLLFESKNLDVARRRTSALSMGDLSDEIAACFELINEPEPNTPLLWTRFAVDMALRSETIADIVAALSHVEGTEPFDELRFWSAQLVRQSRSIHRDMNTFFPWQEVDLAGLAQTGGNGCGADCEAVLKLLTRFPRLADLPELYDAITLHLSNILEFISRDTQNAGDADRLRTALEGVGNARRAALRQTAVFASLAEMCESIVSGMDFGFLLDKERKVFSIGYNVENEKLDDSYYDLLASEARLASFIAVAKGDAPQEHWFRLGRHSHRSARAGHLSHGRRLCSSTLCRCSSCAITKGRCSIRPTPPSSDARSNTVQSTVSHGAFQNRHTMHAICSSITSTKLLAYPGSG